MCEQRHECTIHTSHIHADIHMLVHYARAGSKQGMGEKASSATIQSRLPGPIHQQTSKQSKRVVTAGASRGENAARASASVSRWVFASSLSCKHRAGPRSFCLQFIAFCFGRRRRAKEGSANAAMAEGGRCGHRRARIMFDGGSSMVESWNLMVLCEMCSTKCTA